MLFPVSHVRVLQLADGAEADVRFRVFFRQNRFSLDSHLPRVLQVLQATSKNPLEIYCSNCTGYQLQGKQCRSKATKCTRRQQSAIVIGYSKSAL